MRLDGTMIKAKAKHFYEKIRNDEEFSDVSQRDTFNASHGWFCGFQRRTGVSLQCPVDDLNGAITTQTFDNNKNLFF